MSSYETGKSMTEDQITLLASFILYWVMLAILLYQSGSKRSFIANLLIHIGYSAYFLYGLEYRSEGGNSLAWWFYLLLILWIHAIIHFVQITYQLFLTRKKT